MIYVNENVKKASKTALVSKAAVVFAEQEVIKRNEIRSGTETEIEVCKCRASDFSVASDLD